MRWGVAGRMAAAWLITLPSAGIVGAITYFLVHGIGGCAGTAIGFLLLVAVVGRHLAAVAQGADRLQERQRTNGKAT